MKQRFVGMTREPVFSPGRVGDDAAILLAVAEHLREAGVAVQVCSAVDPIWPQLDPGDVVFTMAQGDDALARLRTLQSAGVRVLNSVDGILNCQRHRTVPLLAAARVAFPESAIVASATCNGLPPWIDDQGAWVKRGDVHATDTDDVSFAIDRAAVRDALQRFARRGIARAIVQRHAAGTVVKFYAVRGRFFHAVPPASRELGEETLRAIDRLGQQAAEVLGVEIYGGDCVVGEDDELKLIDLNDWPSYQRCRRSAAVEIAAYVQEQRTKT
jgi:hypothetical protein